eukprot:jgi/Botrbrau1/20659/Bobra.0465s0001.1
MPFVGIPVGSQWRQRYIWLWCLQTHACPWQTLLRGRERVESQAVGYMYTCPVVGTIPPMLLGNRRSAESTTHGDVVGLNGKCISWMTGGGAGWPIVVLQVQCRLTVGREVLNRALLRVGAGVLLNCGCTVGRCTVASFMEDST